MRMGRYYALSDEQARMFGDAALGIGAVAQALPLDELQRWLEDQRRILAGGVGGVFPTGGLVDVRELDQLNVIVTRLRSVADATDHLARLRAEAEIERAAAPAPEPEPAIPEDWR